MREEEDAKLVLNEAQLLSEAVKQKAAPQENRKLYIKFCLGKDYLLERVKPILAAHRGSVPVCIHIEETKSTAIAPNNLWIAPEENLLQTLKEMLGEGNVVLK